MKGNQSRAMALSLPERQCEPCCSSPALRRPDGRPCKGTGRRGQPYTAVFSDVSASLRVCAAQVMSAQANFVRIRVPLPSTEAAAGSGAPPLEDCGYPEDFSEAALWGQADGETRELLCTARALLKKMNQRVFVGDFVTVTNIDWASGQGTVAAVAMSS